MAGTADIKLRVTTDTGQASAGLKSIAGDTESFGSRFKSTFAGVLAANVVQKVTSAVWDFAKGSVEAYGKAEQTNVKFRDALSRIPGASDATTASLEKQAKALSQVTVYSAGQTKQAMATLASFGLTGDQLKTLTPLVQDYAAKTGTDLPTAAEQVGKALLGQGRALKSVGIDFKDTGSVAGNFEEITAGLQSKVGGLAQEMGSTAAGKMEIMKNQIAALQVSLGKALMPAIQAVISVLMPLVGWIGQNTSWLLPLTAAVVAIVGAIKLWSIAQAVLNAVMAANPILIIVIAVAALVAGIVWLATQTQFFQTIWAAMTSAVTAAINWIRDAAVAVFNWIVGNWPLLLGILTGPIGLAVVLIVQYWDAIVAGVKWLLGQIASFFSMVFGYITAPFITAWNTVYSWIQTAYGWVAAIPGRVAGFLASVVSVLSTPFIAGWNAVNGAIQTAFGWIAAIPGRVAGFLSSVVSVLASPFRAGWDAVNAGISTAMGWVAAIPGRVAGAIAGVFNAIISPFRSAWDWVNSNVFQPIARAVSSATSAISLAKGIWNAFATMWNQIHIKLPQVRIPPFGPTVGGETIGLPRLPTLARGGYFERATLAVIGDRQPSGRGEFALPEGRLQAMLNEAAVRGGAARGPAVVIETAHFQDQTDIDLFLRRVAWEQQRQGV